MRARGWVALALACVLAGCSLPGPRDRPDGAPARVPDGPLPADPVPRVEPKSRYGNPASYVVFGKRYYVMDSARGYSERGVASWYGTKFHGRRTSSGEPYDMHAMTAAHKSLPLPTYVEVTNLQTGKKIVVRVNDRGPFHANRIIDLSYAAARKLGIAARGTGLVEVTALTPGAAPRLRRASATVPAQASSLPAPSPTGASASSTPRIFLQAGAFADVGNARRLQARLESLLATRVDVSAVMRDSIELHRVRLGPLDGVDSADRLAQRIVDAGMSLPRIVID